MSLALPACGDDLPQAPPSAGATSSGGILATETGAVVDSGSDSTGGAPTYAWNLPEGFPPPWVPEDNPMTDAKVELGRHLFYDPRLSGNETQSCSSCHEQARAFADGHGLHRRGAGPQLDGPDQRRLQLPADVGDPPAADARAADHGAAVR